MRNNKKICYTSSYDRGLEHLLKMWFDIKKEVPEAELVIAYGWQLFVKFYSDNPSSMGWKNRMDELMKQDGITHLDRLPQDKLAEEMKTCGIWAYPTHFGEISCISAMKAQVYGCVPVVVNYAALETTVQYGVKVDGDIYDQETKEEYKKQLITLLNDEKRQEEIRKPMIKWAKETLGWDKVSYEWDKEFHGN